MQPTKKDFYNLYVRGNWGFSKTMSKITKLKGSTRPLEKNTSVPSVKETKFNCSVISINATFLEVVDADNRLRGLATPFGLVGGLATLLSGWLVIYYMVAQSTNVPIPIYFLATFLLLLVVLIGFPIFNSLVRRDMFRKTHYPMRFNRRDRKVYAWSQDMGVVTMNWDDIQFYTSEATKSQDRRGMSREEIRGYVRDRNGNMLYHLVFFKYEGFKGMKGVLEIWELVRRYMEEPDGYIQAYQVDQRLLDLDGKRESFIHSLIQATQVIADSRILQVILAMAITWTGTGRLIAKWTCRVPRWPEWVEEKCRVDPNDPYVRNRQTERPLSAREILWPLFCYLLGWAEVLVILYFCFRGYF
ncbi:DUF6708 domain-containing protein [Salinicola lusitanus]|uniref:DUF6708 domain-containing protein n=1 Tax=Salinicola lusitanus TaxID=1949085 RepID=UPI000DA109FF|nr:DUF6708 domain-containing protein [Salinicola lusitanus]